MAFLCYRENALAVFLDYILGASIPLVKTQ